MSERLVAQLGPQSCLTLKLTADAEETGDAGGSIRASEPRLSD